MTPEVSARIFEPFFTTKGATGGTGLGLSTVFGFMNQSGGQIMVHSMPGFGTRISLLLPRATTEVATLASPRCEIAAGKNERILIVEDNALLRQVVTKQISGLGYRVLEAPDAISAFNILEAQTVDLLFTDVVMPGGMDGIELARQARAKWPKLRVLLTSGFAGGAVGQETEVSDGPPALLRKPYRRDALAAALRSALAIETSHHSHAA